MEPMKTLPQSHSTPANQDKVFKPIAVIPPGLQCLVEVEEVVLHKNVFQTSAGKILFSVRQKSEWFGPALNLRLRDPNKREAVSLYTVSSGGWFFRGETYLRIETQPTQPIGCVVISNASRELNVSIQRDNREPVFSAKMPLYPRRDTTIEILSVIGNHPVAIIQKEGKSKSSKVIFQFPLNMEAKQKAVILCAFLYMTYQVTQRTRRRSSHSSGWGTAGRIGGGDHLGGINCGVISGACGGVGGGFC